MGSNVDNVSTSSDVEVVFTIVCYIVGVFFYAMLVRGTLGGWGGEEGVGRGEERPAQRGCGRGGRVRVHMCTSSTGLVVDG